MITDAVLPALERKVYYARRRVERRRAQDCLHSQPALKTTLSRERLVTLTRQGVPGRRRGDRVTG